MDNQNPNNQVPPISSVPSTGNNAGGQNNSGPQAPAKGLMETLEYYFVTKAPFQIPANIRELIVKFTPWINVIFLLTIVPLVLTVVGLSSLFTFYAGSYFYHAGWGVYNIISLVTLVLGIMALPGLFKRTISGWKFTFYEIVVSFVGSLFSGSIIGGLISLVIGLFVLFQVKSYYK
ncbi:MAG TPA: chromate transporter [bacterium]|nr:chromate transporter [bacterium]HPL95839.1 chromate transporter [bacterium]